MLETVETLWIWTPYLLEGFGWNILISLTAGLIGLLIGAPLAFMHHTRFTPVARSSHIVSAVIHNLPTFALIFYTAMTLPSELSLPLLGFSISIPYWFKAALALSAMQIGYVSENLSIALKAWHQGDTLKALLFIPGWVNGFVITVIASSNASVVGVDELISRSNNVINASGHTNLMIPLYLYAGLFFLVFCFPLSVGINAVKTRMSQRLRRSKNP
jgi:polar amino acid transport system permease protein